MVSAFVEIIFDNGDNRIPVSSATVSHVEKHVTHTVHVYLQLTCVHMNIVHMSVMLSLFRLTEKRCP